MIIATGNEQPLPGTSADERKPKAILEGSQLLNGWVRVSAGKLI